MKPETVHRIVQTLLRAPYFPGRNFLVERIPGWLLKRPEGKVVFTSKYGYRMEINPGEDYRGLERTLYERGVYEFGLLEWLYHHLQSGDHVMDIGANIGLISLTAAVVVGKNGSVTAFEPHPNTRACLERNIRLNGFSNVEVSSYGLGAVESKLAMHEEVGNRGGATLDDTAFESEGSLEIEVMALDTFVERHAIDRLDLIKIDVEGWELQVLLGAKKTLQRFRPKLIVEIDDDRKLEGGDIRQMVDWICSQGYSLHKLNKGKELPGNLIELGIVGELPAHDNLIFLPGR
ncbi:MAG: FkbM family methyltransferase [Flavobacteriales bacterium]|nr:FkbM family methyltransferase [Flavobacteriales bacterium]